MLTLHLLLRAACFKVWERRSEITSRNVCAGSSGARGNVDKENIINDGVVGGNFASASQTVNFASASQTVVGNDGNTRVY